MADGSEENREFLGAGLAFPLGVDEEGKVRMNRLEDQVRQSILLILQTAPCWISKRDRWMYVYRKDPLPPGPKSCGRFCAS